MIGSHILAALNGTDITADIEELILKHRVLGFTMFRRNIESPEQLVALTTDLQNLAAKAGYKLVLAVDQEGGRVARLNEPYFVKIPPMKKWAEYFVATNKAESLFQLGEMLAEQCLACGFNLDFAPVVDVNTLAENPIIGDRSFGSDPELVYICARNIMRGMHKAGLINCIKHFPGHGATMKDSHLDLPVDARTRDEIFATDITPFRKLIAENLVDSVMTAHVVYPELDVDMPATVSHKIIQDILRKELNYQGVVFSDDMMMKAISEHYGIEKAIVDFLKAGGDVALICEKPELSLEIIRKLASNADQVGLGQYLQISEKRLVKLTDKLSQPIVFNKQTSLTQLVTRHQHILNNFFG